MSEVHFAKAVNDSEFETTIASSQLTVVDFWAEWCGPCRILGPVIEGLAKEYEGKAQIRKMDVDSNPSTPAKFQIRGIPTVIFFKDGKVVDQVVGAQPKDVFKSLIDKHV